MCTNLLGEYRSMDTNFDVTNAYTFVDEYGPMNTYVKLERYQLQTNVYQIY